LELNAKKSPKTFRFWDSLFHTEKDCKHYSSKICIYNVMNAVYLDIFRESDLFCKGMCENFERKNDSSKTK